MYWPGLQSLCLCAAIHPPLLFSLQKYPSSSSHRASDVVVHGFLTFKPRPANHNAVTEKPDGTQKLPEEVLNSYLLKTWIYLEDTLYRDHILYAYYSHCGKYLHCTAHRPSFYSLYSPRTHAVLLDRKWMELDQKCFAKIIKFRFSKLSIFSVFQSHQVDIQGNIQFHVGILSGDNLLIQ